ncbi:MAG TPA: bifunctional adenosylcobinamide kinase/adenosylcobinamide-phosphate guanylyltransferase [Xanthobacteraceae bacterium]|jgi:adenosylcobinamide kinase/adenosylcobinamide-phosphate guanylyltransferase|nr:bifunctional adenosylcobinamide kinase/adenosylcobinamide-phosphate guanylyltransferase [Xanthobacteraceae bacterium]
MLTLVLGGARSGKSRHAEKLITAAPPPWFYLATAEALDDEMSDRIAQHRARRDGRWQTLEVPHDLPVALAKIPQGASVLVDCLTLWLTNLMMAERKLETEFERLEKTLVEMQGNIVLVSNEVGLGIVPENALARRFRDEAGRLNQRIAAQADRVVLLVAGIPINVK